MEAANSCCEGIKKTPRPHRVGDGRGVARETVSDEIDVELATSTEARWFCVGACHKSYWIHSTAEWFGEQRKVAEPVHSFGGFRFF